MANLKFIKLTEKYKNHFIKTEFDEGFLDFSKIENIKQNFSQVLKWMEKVKKGEQEDALKGEFLFLVDLDNEIDEILAWVNIRVADENNDLIKKVGHIGYWTNKKFRRRGLANYALETMLKHAKNTYNLDEIIITHDFNNIASEKVIKAFDYNYLGEFIEGERKYKKYILKTEILEKDLVDLHAHPLKEYYLNPNQEIKNNFINGIEKMFFIATDINETFEIDKEFRLHKNVFPVYGVHPNNIKNEPFDFHKLEKILEKKEAVAIGEIGLDYFYETNAKPEFQILALETQIKLAQKYNLPVILHIRDAHKDIYNILNKTEYKDIKFIFHSYSGDLKWTEKFLSFNNVYFSFSGVITFKKNFETRKVIELIPNDRIFSETDAPYLTPEPYRSKTNHSHYVSFVVETIALIKGIKKEKMKKIIMENVMRVFGV
ncbi:TatD family hydrolase [Mesomycoplasma lagogenitalium]|uniref:YchF/TatD family DNA exonuclease n=1 Tax=Mesomycoplasma lagogenitalium TaxID=171286 RepID=A0ABY8LWB0_9BACT|nr:TatD family hydrolase [Mesomycoplasma lagogenitalium]WGI36706.1 YchF/TatD family DNA exonuclease [Mesomycoplasma lagogenitalium]